MPTYDRKDLKEGGWAQTREAIQSFEGDVQKVQEGQWAPRRNDDGTVQEPKEFLDITCINNRVLEATEEPSMDIAATFNFRVNMSETKGNFWDNYFLDACEKLQILLPTGLTGKHITWKKMTYQSIRKGIHNPQFDSTNYIPIAIGAGQAPLPVATTTGAAIPTQATITADPMEMIADLAIGKTDAQFKSAVGLDPRFISSPYLPLAKSGAITQTLLAQGKLKMVADASGKQVYSR